MDDELRKLVSGAGELGIDLSGEQRLQFQKYAELLMDWNRRLNLVRVSGRPELLRIHMLDSLWCSVAIDLRGSLKLLDIGSGAGFPGIPLRICFPGIALYLLESQQKRSLFLTEAVRCLGLDSCTVLTGRAEDIARDDAYREGFSCVVARAVAPLSTLAELALPFVAPGSLFVALKGSAANEEIADAEYALEELGGSIEQVIPYGFSGERGRNVISIKKNFPRLQGFYYLEKSRSIF